MKIFNSIKNSGKLIIRYFLKTVYLRNIFMNPATSEAELCVICDISEYLMNCSR